MVNSYGKKLRFDQPANDFAMPFQLKWQNWSYGIWWCYKRKIIFNEATLWSGSDGYTYPEDVYKVLRDNRPGDER